METNKNLFVVFCDGYREEKRKIFLQSNTNNSTTLLFGSPKQKEKFSMGINVNFQNEDSIDFYSHFMAIKGYIYHHRDIITVIPIGTPKQIGILEYLWEKNPRESSCITGKSFCPIIIGKEKKYVPLLYKNKVGIEIIRFFNLYKRSIYDLQERKIVKQDLKKFKEHGGRKVIFK